MVRPLTQKLWDAIWLDLIPEGMAVRVDFGIDTVDHYRALQFAVRGGGVTIEALDEAIGSGPKLTKLVDVPHQPSKVEFKTAYDGMLVECDDCWDRDPPGCDSCGGTGYVRL